VLDLLVGIQSAINDTFAARISAFSQSRDWVGLLGMLPSGVLFGVVHALTPGHSKSVLATYLLGSGLSGIKSVVTALVLALTHIASAVVLALVASELVSRTITSAGQAPLLEYISRGLLVAIAAWLILRAILNRPHEHGEGAVVGFIAGLVPCPLTLFVMFFAASRGVPEAGLVFAAAMLVGVGAVLVAVAGLTIVAHGMLLRYAPAVGHVSRVLEGLAGLALLVIATQQLAR
jgi:nickel/cobalt exporter